MFVNSSFLIWSGKMKKEIQLRRETQALTHPRDRKVRQLQKKEKRLSKMMNRKQMQTNARLLKVMRFIWFRTQCVALGYTTTPVPADVIPLLVQLYINRNLDELMELKSRPNPPAGRIKEIETVYAEEMEAFKGSGLEIPVLTNSDDVEILTEIWDGIPETSCVVETALVPQPDSLDEVKLNQIQSQLVSLDSVREEAVAVLPRRMAKKTEKLLRSKNEKKKSVKRMDGADDIRRRTAAKQSSKQKERSKKETKEALAKLRKDFP